ncbi:MAG TPA: chromosomal replication initiator protein DnaA [Dissulfurispiraceae bacterium]|nr:chromosomal replication initiator protein DnaA [Dissulfurispiraceae bacterium]
MVMLQQKEEVWEKVLDLISGKVGEGSFELWFKPMKLIQIKDKTAYFEIPNRFFREWIDDNYPMILSESIEAVTEQRVGVKFRIVGKEDETLKKIDSRLENRRTKLASRGIHLNPKHMFDTFVVGPSNQFAHAAAKRVAENPGTAYNPLFLYGGVGLGKTHLMNAIGNMIVDKNPGMGVHYVSSEQFVNEVVSAMRHERMSDFKEKYRNADVLLVDDIQFIAGKTATQEEFFHTFNALYGKQKQIVISSDRAPMDISDITDRMRSRFSMGLIADIQPPEVETKMAILYKKAEADHMKIPEDVAYFIANRVKSNIRDLEGCLIKLGAHASLVGVPIDLALAKNVLKDLISDDDRPITVDRVQREVCDFFGMKPGDLKAKRRTREISNARQIAMYITKQLTQMSLTEIGAAFGGKDHATVIYACKQVDAKRAQDETFNKTVENIIKRLKQ